MSIEHVHIIGIHYCKTSNFNYMNFRVSVQVPVLNINQPAGHIIPRSIHHDHRPPSRPLSW